jgi:hypothetical protein
MYVCMYIFILPSFEQTERTYVCMYVCMYVCIPSFRHRVNTRSSIRSPKSLLLTACHICMHARIYICAFSCICYIAYVDMCACMYICLYTMYASYRLGHTCTLCMNDICMYVHTHVWILMQTELNNLFCMSMYVRAGMY